MHGHISLEKKIGHIANITKGTEPLPPKRLSPPSQSSPVLPLIAPATKNLRSPLPSSEKSRTGLPLSISPPLPSVAISGDLGSTETSGRPSFAYRKCFGNGNAAETRETAQKRGGNVSLKFCVLGHAWPAFPTRFWPNNPLISVFVLPLFSFFKPFPSRVTPTARNLRCRAPHRTARHCRARSPSRRPSSSPPASSVISELCVFWSVLLLLPPSVSLCCASCWLAVAGRLLHLLSPSFFSRLLYSAAYFLCILLMLYYVMLKGNFRIVDEKSHLVAFQLGIQRQVRYQITVTVQTE
ncbi:hypothetical protein RJT34_17586 [Clitoria ternatea]|uniref:Uncharacterized protein n=1 Tax=Clitoria ternatea TaxID=43366 RepID=A0AAN9PDE7_CLITE